MAGVSTKEIKNRIRSMESTKQITKAMEMVATSKLRKAQAKVAASRPYFQIFSSAISDIISANTDFSSPYLVQRPVKKSVYIVIAGDRGLAGGYNSNILKQVVADMEGRESVVLPIGKKAVDFFQSKRIPMLTANYAVAEAVSLGDCFSIAKKLSKGFLAGEYDEVFVAYTNFVSVLSQVPVSKRLLPLLPEDTQRNPASQREKINSFLAKEQYEEAIKFFNLVSLKKEGSLDSDKKIWNELKILIAKAQEDTRVKTKKSILEKKFEEKKFEDVVAECENENTGEERHKNIWEELKTKANESIKARDRKKELSRIEKRKEQISKLLNEKKFAEVIEECNKENGAYPGSRPEDFNIWSSFRNNAQIEKDKIDRAQEESRIAAKIDLVNKLLVDKKFSEVVSLCDEERGQYHGSRPEDLTQWKSIKSKALATDLLSRNDERSQSSFCLKGFYPGMSEEEVVILLDHYFPSLSYSRKSSYIEIPGQAMRFCEIKQGKVVRLNFNKQMLEKLLDIHDQDDENMITYLSNMYHINFRSAHIRDRKSKGSASVSVSQISYTHKNSHKSFCVTYFGEKDISDYNKDPEEIEQEAKARVMSFGNNMAYKDIAYQIGYRAGYAAQCVKIVRAWLKDEYDNGKGAAEGTLRIEYLDL